MVDQPVEALLTLRPRAPTAGSKDGGDLAANGAMPMVMGMGGVRVPIVVQQRFKLLFVGHNCMLAPRADAPPADAAAAAADPEAQFALNAAMVASLLSIAQATQPVVILLSPWRTYPQACSTFMLNLQQSGIQTMVAQQTQEEWAAQRTVANRRFEQQLCMEVMEWLDRHSQVISAWCVVAWFQPARARARRSRRSRRRASLCLSLSLTVSSPLPPPRAHAPGRSSTPST